MASSQLEMLLGDDCSSLKSWFIKILDNVELDINVEMINSILLNDLSIKMDELDQNLKEILPYMLLYYVKVWPGWEKHSEFREGKLTFTAYFIRFRQYITFKLNFIIKSGYNKAVESLKSENSNETAPGIATFKINISGPPTLLNSIIFVDINNDAIIKRHVAPKFKPIKYGQLLNWPYVAVKFESPELTFTRHNVTGIERYLSVTSEKIKFPKSEFLENMEIIDPNVKRHCFSHVHLEAYIRQYTEFLSRPTMMEQTLASDITTLLDEFLMDVKEIGQNDTIATNTKILFNIGGCKYVRSKKVKATIEKEEPLIKYYEMITPRIELILEKFSAEYDQTQEYMSFKKLNYLNNSNNENELKAFTPRITYICLFCNKVFNTNSSSKRMFSHLRDDHGMEQLLYCLQCHQKRDVSYLSSSRWKHNCTTSNNSKSNVPAV